MTARTAEYDVGAEVATDDGFSGELRRLVVDPGARRLTHLIITPRHEGGRRRLVPATFVEATPTGLRMSCTTAEFEALTPADTTEFVVDPTADPASAPQCVLHHGDRVHASDSTVGRFHGLRVEVPDHQITHVVLDVGRLWTKKRVVVPIDVVTDLADGLSISLTAAQIRGAFTVGER